MNKDNVIKSLKRHYYAMFAVILITLLAFEFGLKDGLFIENVSPNALYVIQVFAIMFTVVFIPLAIVGFTKSIEKAMNLPQEAFFMKFLKRGMRRINLLAAVMAVNILVYYRFGYDGALYCGLLGLGAMVYSFPTKNVLEQYLNGKKK